MHSLLLNFDLHPVSQSDGHHGLVAAYILQPITVHDTEVLRNLIGQSNVTGHQAMFRETVCQ